MIIQIRGHFNVPCRTRSYGTRLKIVPTPRSVTLMLVPTLRLECNEVGSAARLVSPGLGIPSKYFSVKLSIDRNTAERRWTDSSLGIYLLSQCGGMCHKAGIKWELNPCTWRKDFQFRKLELFWRRYCTDLLSLVQWGRCCHMVRIPRTRHHSCIRCVLSENGNTIQRWNLVCQPDVRYYNLHILVSHGMKYGTRPG